MVLMRTENTQYNRSNSFGKIINKIQDSDIEKHKGSWKKKKT